MSVVSRTRHLRDGTSWDEYLLQVCCDGSACWVHEPWNARIYDNPLEALAVALLLDIFPPVTPCGVVDLAETHQAA